MNDFNDHDVNGPASRISRALTDAATNVEVPTIGVSAVRRRGNLRQHRRRAALATLSAVALVGAGVLTVQRLSSNPSPSTRPASVPSGDSEPTSASLDTVFSTAPANPPDAGSVGEPVNRVESAFVWNAVEPGSAEAVSSLVWGIPPTQDAPYLLWSTAPGPTTDGVYQPTMYRSDDGIHWSPAEDGTFTEPQVSKRGLVSQGGTLFAFGTAAATAAIPQGGAGDAVVDISSDGGTTWQPQVLPIDLRGLAEMDGVGGVGMSGALAASNGAVVAVALPNVWWGAQQQGRELVLTADGAYEITQPTCQAPRCTMTATTTVGLGGSVGTAPAETMPVSTGSAVTDDTTPIVSGLIPFEQLGIDPASVAAARTPRAFVSTDGATFTEVEFPALPATAIGGGDVQVFTAGGAFYARLSITTFDPEGEYSGYVGGNLVYRSSDGSNWTQVGDLANPAGQDMLGVMSDGTLVGRSYANDGSVNVTTSSDGVNWQQHDLRPLIDESDGQIAYVDLWTTTVDEQGITAIAAISNDPIAEAGGRSLERDGVRLEMTSSRNGGPFAFDVATGDALAQDRLFWDESGMSVLDSDGTTRASFTNGEMSQLQNSEVGQLTTRVLLHSDDGVNWSRENLADISGSPGAGPGFIRTQDGTVLITLVDAEKRTNTMATTVVLVGTRK